MRSPGTRFDFFSEISGARGNGSAVRALILRLSDDLSGAVGDVGEMSINVSPRKERCGHKR